MRKKKVQIIEYTTRPIPKMVPVAGMTPPMAIPYEEAPIISKKPDKALDKKPTRVPTLSPSKDYELRAMEAPITEYESDVEFPVAPITSLHAEEISVEPEIEEATSESITAEEPVASEEVAEPACEEPISDTVSEPSAEVEASPSETVTEESVVEESAAEESVSEEVAEPEVVTEAKLPEKKAPKKKKKPKKAAIAIAETTPKVRTKPKYDLSKVVFPGEKKEPVKIKAKVVTKIIGSDGTVKKVL